MNPEAISRGWLHLSVVVILAATLTPQPGSSNLAQGFFAPPLPDTFASDLIQNVLLYVPFGVVLRLRGRSLFRTTCEATALSFITELCQFLIPGRDPVLTDVVINTIGGSVGWALASMRPALIRAQVFALERWLLLARRPNARVAARLSLAWAGGAALLMTVTLWLLTPALPEPFYFLVGTPFVDVAPGPVRIGSDGRFGVFRGLIDEVRIYATARDPEAIRIDMQSPVSASAADPNLLAGYGFDSPDPQGALDAVTSQRAVVRRATWTDAGRFGGALMFDGRNSEVVTTLFPQAALRRAMTIEAWVNPSEMQRGSSTIVADDGGAFALRASLHERTRAPMMMAKLGENMREARSRTPLSPNTWTHLAAVYDGRSIVLFIDGKPSVRLRHWSNHHPARMSLDRLALTPGLVPSPASVLSILSGDFALDLTLRCGTLENEHAPVFTLIGVQSLQTLTVNASGQELQVGWLSWSRRMGLAPVEYRVPNGLSGCAPGQTREITVKGPLSDVRLLDHAGAALQGDGPGVGSAWAFLFDSRVLPVPLVGIVSVAYLALLAIPFGFWARRSWATIAGIVLLGVVVAVAPDAFRARPVSGAECAGLTAGAILGAIIRPRTTPSGASSS